MVSGLVVEINLTLCADKCSMCFHILYRKQNVSVTGSGGSSSSSSSSSIFCLSFSHLILCSRPNLLEQYFAQVGK